MVNINAVKETTLTVEKKPLAVVLPYLGTIALNFCRLIFYCKSIPCSGCLALHGVNPNLIKVQKVRPI